MDQLVSIIKTKTTGLFSFVLLSGLLLSAFVYYSAQQVEEKSTVLVDENIPLYQKIEKLSAKLIEQERLLYEYYATDDRAFYIHRQGELMNVSFVDQSERVDALLQQFELRFKNDENVANLMSIQGDIVQEAALLDKNMASPSTDWDAARESLSRLASLRNQAQPYIAMLNNQVRSWVDMASQDNRSQLEQTKWLVIGYSILICIFAYILAMVVKNYVQETSKSRRLALFPIANPNPILTIDQALDISFFNPATNKLAEQVCEGKTLDPACLLPPDIEHIIPTMIENNVTEHTTEYPASHYLLLANIYWHKEQQSFDLHIQDVTERRRAEEKLNYQAYHNRTSGLFNEFKLANELDAMINRNAAFSVGLLEIRNFAQLQSRQGIEASNALVEMFSQRLNRSIPERVNKSSFQLFHTGKHAFCILAENVVTDTDLNFWTRLIEDEIEKTIVTPYGEFNVELDFGFAIHNQHGQTRDTLLTHARAALQRAIETEHSSYILYSECIGEQIEKEDHLLNELTQAIKNEDLFLNFQPQLDISTNQIIGMETLVRWKLKGDWVSPADFIPIAEQSGQIIPLGNWILEQACFYTKELINEGHDQLVVAVNISPRQFQHPDFIASVSKTLVKTELSPQHLELEITEGVILGYEEDTILALSQLKELGVKLSIDDFGTGYSSLSYLSRFPIDKLKIDQAFIRTMESESTQQAIVKTIIDLGKNLNLTTIAEGVEEQEQLDLLRGMSCHEIQGYFFSRPLDAGAFKAFITHHAKSQTMPFAKLG